MGETWNIEDRRPRTERQCLRDSKMVKRVRETRDLNKERQWLRDKAQRMTKTEARCRDIRRHRG